MIQLSQPAEDRIERVRAEAEKRYQKLRNDFDRDLSTYSIWAQSVSEAAVGFLHEVFFAYTAEFLNSGASTAEVRLSAEATLDTLTDELLLSVKWPAFKPLPQNSSISLQDLIEAKKRQVINDIERQEGWQDFQDKLAALAQSPSAATTKPTLKVAFIREWMHEEGWDNKTLADELKVSERVVSSILNNGAYHGSTAVTKLANLMGRDVIDLYLN